MTTEGFINRLKALLPLGAALGVLALPAAAYADCSALDQEVRTAMAAGKIDRFEDLYRQALAEPTCDSAYRTRLGIVLARTWLKALDGEIKAAKRQPKIEELEAIRRIAEPWQLMVTLGDAYYEARDWPKAFRAYETALDDMRNEKANPTPPPEAIERHAYQRAIQARALAPTFIASRTTRGAPSGLASPKFRNFTAVTVPVPVRFAYNSSQLEPDGVAAAREILDFLKSEGVKGVRLFGHTDPVGSDGFNMGLSEARAATVQQFLRDNGFAGIVEIVPLGESRPFRPDDPGKYSEEELHAMHRRVEYQVIE